MKKNLLAVVVALGLCHSAVFANPPADLVTGKATLTIDESSSQQLKPASSPLKTNPFAIKSEGSYVVAPLCWTWIDPVYGFAEEFFWEEWWTIEDWIAAFS